MPDTNQEIAQMLSTQRKNQGLSIEEIFERTRINPDFLNALETGDFDILPKAYARLFLKTYAKEVGLDPEEVLSLYEKNTAPTTQDPAPPPPQHRQTSMVPILLIAFAVVIVIIIAINLQQQDETSAPLDASATAQTATPQTAPKTTQETATTQLAAQDAQPTPVQSPAEPPSDTAPPSSEAEISQPITTESQANTTSAPTETSALPSAAQQTDTPSPTPAPGDTLPSNIAPEVTPSNTEPTAPDSPPESGDQASNPDQTATSNPSLESTPTESEPEVLTSYALPMPVLLTDEETMTLSGFVRETTQLSISADGRQIFDGVLQAGSQQRWQARDRFQLQVQRAGAIALSLQDQPLESASPPDRTLRLNVSRTLIRVEELGEPASNR